MICPNCKSRNVKDMPFDSTVHVFLSYGMHFKLSLIEEFKK